MASNNEDSLRILKLTLSRLPFDVMEDGEKRIEIRKPSKWILSRLIGKDYDYIQFTNGYRKDSRRFYARFNGWHYADSNEIFRYSNGLVVYVEPGDIIIDFTLCKKTMFN